jgi:hypothetical protein
MSFNLGHLAFREGAAAADRLLRNRWLQAALFVAVFLAVWLLGMKSALALG